MKEVTAMRQNLQTQQMQQNLEPRITDTKQSQRDLKIISYRHAVIERNEMHDRKNENKLQEHNTRGGAVEILKIQLNS